MKDIKVGVVGCGSIAEIAHFPSIAKRPNAKLVAVADVDPGRGQQAAAKWGAEQVYTDYREMYAKAGLDAVIVATPNCYHRNQVINAARHKLHVLVEKPMAVTNKEGWDMVKACKDAGVKLMVGCDRRYWTHNQWAKELIEQGVIGKLLMSRVCMHEGWRYYQGSVAKTDFRKSLAMTGGAAINDTGAHAIDLLIWLNGSKVKRAVGVAKKMMMPDSYTLTDDVALAIVEFENGAMGTISSNRISPAITQNNELCGTEGTIFTASDATNPFQSWPMAVYTDKEYSNDDLPEILKNFRWPEIFWAEDIVNPTVRKRWVPICPPRFPSNYDRMIEHFFDCLTNDKQPLTSGEDGARATEIMCAVLKSMDTGGWVDTDLTEEVVPKGYEPPPEE